MHCAAVSTSDRSEDALAFLLAASAAGRRTALATLVGIDGGAPRELGARMAIDEDGGYVGYLSGGCVEGAVVAEARDCIATGRPRTLRFGKGSPFFDITLACGGGIDVHIAPVDDIAPVRAAAESLAHRRPASLPMGAHAATWRPATRLLVAGRGPEMAALLPLAIAAGYPIAALCGDDLSLTAARAAGLAPLRLTTTGALPHESADPWTAVICLFHDPDWDHAVLRRYAAGDAFYVGALGSRATHDRRLEALAAAGWPAPLRDRVKGPIGLFPSARDSRSLAISILADIALAEAALDA